VAVSRLIGDDTQSFSVCGLIYEALRHGIESNLAGSELSCPPDARRKGNDDYRADKKGSDLYAVGSLDDVHYRRVGEHDRNQAKSCRCPQPFLSREKISLIVKCLGHTRQLSAGKRRRKNYDSLNLVHCCWVDRGRYREISDARAHDDFLDNRAGHHRVDHRRRGYPHVFAPDNRTIPSRRPHFFHPWRDPGPLRLHQAEYPFSPRSLIKFQKRGQLFLRSHDETLSVIAMRISNPDSTGKI
jgi:hypothetical protein